MHGGAHMEYVPLYMVRRDNSIIGGLASKLQLDRFVLLSLSAPHTCTRNALQPTALAFSLAGGHLPSSCGALAIAALRVD